MSMTFAALWNAHPEVHGDDNPCRRRGDESFRNRSGDHIDLWSGSRLTARNSYLRIHWGMNIDGIWSSYSHAKEVWFWRMI